MPPSITYTQMQKFPFFQKEVANKASTVYNDMYRERQYSQFILCDTGNNNLDGKVGFVDWYDTDSGLYHALLCPHGSSSFENSRPASVKPEYMQQVKKVRLYEYNKTPKRDDCDIGISNLLPNKEGEIFQVRVRHDVFQHICKVHDCPETCSNEASKTMTRLLGEREKKEEEDQASLAKERDEYNRNLNNFFSKHDQIIARPRKKPRANRILPSLVDGIQVQAVWKAKFEHIRYTMNHHTEDDGEHLFTFPFATTDNSLASCGEGLNQLNAHHSEGVHQDSAFSSNMKMEPVVITTASIRSLSPGINMDEDIMNLCLKW